MGKNKADEEAKKKPQTAEDTKKEETTEQAGAEETKESGAEEKEAQAKADEDKDVSGETGAEDAAEDASETEAAEEAEETDETEDDTDEKAGDKKKFFSKREKKDKKDEKIEELTDRVARQMAEFENFRKRTEKEKSQMFETGAKSIIEKILPVIDNFERGLAAVPEEEKDSPFVDGMDKIYRQLLTELENAGVTAIEAVGQEFDPELHNAVMQVESEEYDSGIVAQELQKGYKYRDTVVRHSMVAVVQ